MNKTSFRQHGSVTKSKYASVEDFSLDLLAGSSNSVDAEEIYFDFMKQRFVYSKETNTFCKLCYPTKETMGYYLKTSGYGTEVVAATKKWGRNLIEYPSPTLTKLMKKQCMQPTFVFQVFSALSWSINGYWYYSLFALFMLFMFESIVAKACLMIKSALAYTRGVSQSRILMVYLCGKWKKLSGT
ncbi:unnamed protein product [Fraxinus pennsylvanica]|uniref:Uncharacterized protein n=1 Tax=Fraxinus pennsylvanica TaxID=56036 RepID=A0AAD2E3D6_9LAMI|nr:unnamed protein product [Fraxinus pennsylvanica]